MRLSREYGLKFGGGGWIVLFSLVWLINCLTSLSFFLSFLYSFHLPGPAMVHDASKDDAVFIGGHIR
jgi:hypothetical protein